MKGRMAFIHTPLVVRVSKIFLIASLTGLAFVWIYPFLWVLGISLMGPGEVFRAGVNFIPEQFVWENYVRAWRVGRFNQYFLNSVIVTAATIAIVVLRSAMGGYVLGRFEFVGKRLIVTILVTTFLVPVGASIIPIVDLSVRMGMLNTRTGMILALAGSGHVPPILLYMGFFTKMPMSLSESAVLDGAGFWTIFHKIMLPLCGPVTATVVILSFMFAWNNLMIPLVFSLGNPRLRTLPVGMVAFQSEHETDWTGMAAAATIALVPILITFVSLQKHFVHGIAGAIKE